MHYKYGLPPTCKQQSIQASYTEHILLSLDLCTLPQQGKPKEMKKTRLRNLKETITKLLSQVPERRKSIIIIEVVR